MAPTAIVFGPTGGVGSAAALAARERGAKVILAMRDPQKSIPTLEAEEAKGGFERVRADLTQPKSVSTAVTKTGAKHAFIYWIQGATDGMRSALEALKTSGVEYVVFLSTISVQGDLRSIPQSEIIPYGHAQVEISLEEIFGRKHFVAIRPATFASNSIWWKDQIPKGEVSIFFPESMRDWITPTDVGNVAGAFLANGPSHLGSHGDENHVDLCGPQLKSQGDAARVIGRVIGKDIEVRPASDTEGLKIFKNLGVPEFVAKYLVESFKKDKEKGGSEIFRGQAYKDAAANVKKYSGKEPTSFDDWAAQNKQLFTA